MKKQVKTLAILLAVVALLAVGVLVSKYFVERQTNAPVESDRKVVYQIDIDSIEKVEWSYTGIESLCIEKQADGRFIFPDEPEEPLSSTKVLTILQSISEITSRREIENADPVAYGFTEPTNVVKVTASGKVHEFVFGSLNSMKDQFYLSVDGHTYMVELFENNVFNKERKDLYDREEEEVIPGTFATTAEPD